ncbi:MAG: MerR family transcriptional regulator [Pseudomonadota bacterium]
MKSRAFIASADIARETGFGRDQLRKWRQRFQFPPLEFTAEGKPGYSVNTVNQLRLVKRLLEGGFRPGYVVGKTLEELERLHVAVSGRFQGDSPMNRLVRSSSSLRTQTRLDF